MTHKFEKPLSNDDKLDLKLADAGCPVHGPAPKQPIKIGQPLWDELLNADESLGYAICNTCEKIVKGYPELYVESTVQDIICPNCYDGTLEPTGDLIVADKLIEDTGELNGTPLSYDILDVLKGLFCDLGYDELYTRHIDKIERALMNDDLSIHHPALQLMLKIIHSYDGELN